MTLTATTLIITGLVLVFGFRIADFISIWILDRDREKFKSRLKKENETMNTELNQLSSTLQKQKESYETAKNNLKSTVDDVMDK